MNSCQIPSARFSLRTGCSRSTAIRRCSNPMGLLYALFGRIGFLAFICAYSFVRDSRACIRLGLTFGFVFDCLHLRRNRTGFGLGVARQPRKEVLATGCLNPPTSPRLLWYYVHTSYSKQSESGSTVVFVYRQFLTAYGPNSSSGVSHPEANWANPIAQS